MRFLKKYGNYSTFEIDEMYPFEMEIYLYMIIKEIREELEEKRRG